MLRVDAVCGYIVLCNRGEKEKSTDDAVPPWI